ncbi:MAG: hypothetical protein WDO19_02840 [Bacteroidota bacterium]
MEAAKPAAKFPITAFIKIINTIPLVLPLIVFAGSSVSIFDGVPACNKPGTYITRIIKQTAEEIRIPVNVVIIPPASMETVLASPRLCLLKEKSEKEIVKRNRRLPAKSNHVSVKVASLQKNAAAMQ